MLVHFDGFWYERLDKKNAQNVGFEHFGTLWYSSYAEKRGTRTFSCISLKINN